MKKNYFYFVTLSIFLLNFNCFKMLAQTTNLAPYCAVGYDAKYNMITSMNFNGTVFNGFGAVGSWTNQSPHRYFNTTTLNAITAGSTFNISITFPSVNDIEPSYYAVWIDFNNNLTFESTEMVMHNQNTNNALLPSFGAASVTVTKTITVPNNALAGQTRMRIMRSQNDASPFPPFNPDFRLDPCAGFINGQPRFGYNCTVDFNVTINNTLSIDNIDKTEFTVHPNPTSSYVTFQTNLTSYSVVLTDIYGKSLGNFLNKSQMDLSAYPSGVYFARISDLNNLNASKSIKIVRN